eukprot:TRINITY_DN4077_c1_g3_i4.p2 TRINITY_DN4077_c1_g3~~TRINITY_DN4077_c1_g3_i4.p2  ORF type:complete len:107 (+),score=11.47 TRINITY_DN4077_c1_g3_i4:336-656(+)
MTKFPELFKDNRTIAFEAYLTYLSHICKKPREELRHPARLYFNLLGPAEKSLWADYVSMLIKRGTIKEGDEPKPDSSTSSKKTSRTKTETKPKAKKTTKTATTKKT